MRYQVILHAVCRMVKKAWLSWLKVTVMAEGQHRSPSCEYFQAPFMVKQQKRWNLDVF